MGRRRSHQVAWWTQLLPLLLISVLPVAADLANHTGQPSRPSDITDRPSLPSDVSDLVHLSHPSSAGGKLCRYQFHFLPPELFARHACALCYGYHPTFNVGYSGLRWSVQAANVPLEGQLYQVLHLSNGSTLFVADPDQPDPRLVATFPTRRDVTAWADCCRSAAECCRSMRRRDTADPTWCPSTWDGWQCWDSTPPSTVATAECPSYVHSMTTPSCDRSATKKCEDNGRWYTFRNGANRTQEWSDYGSCSPVPTLLMRLYVHVSAYAVSLVALVPALVIFFSYKQLKVHRVCIHKHFFLSLLLNAVMVILFKCVVILDELGPNKQGQLSLIQQNGFGCKLLFIMTKYFRITNYLWQFCESFYLHKLIASAFAEQRSLVVFYIIGWGFPALPVAVYAGLRARSADDLCWVLPVEMYEWVLNAPCLLSLVMCTAFLINIIRVLVTKLRAADHLRVGEHAHEVSQYRKAVRAALVLVPLFGLHLMATIYRPTGGPCTLMELYYYADYLLDGLQGALVALIFCYLNGEVQSLLRRTYGRYASIYWPSLRSYHRDSSLSSRSQHTIHTMVGLDNATTSISAAVEPAAADSLLCRRPEKECRL